MEAIKYSDRIFTTECNDCRAFLHYQTSDIFYNNELIEVPQYIKNEMCEIVSVDYKKMKDTRPYVICPICKNKQYI